MDDQPPAALKERTIAFACSTCGRKFSVKPEFAGRSTTCPACKEALVVPQSAADRTVACAAQAPQTNAPLGETRAAGDRWATVAHQQREEIIERFEAAWHGGTQPAIDDFLPAHPTERAVVLVELVHADLEWRLKAIKGLQTLNGINANELLK